MSPTLRHPWTKASLSTKKCREGPLETSDQHSHLAVRFLPCVGFHSAGKWSEGAGVYSHRIEHHPSGTPENLKGVLLPHCSGVFTFCFLLECSQRLRLSLKKQPSSGQALRSAFSTQPPGPRSARVCPGAYRWQGSVQTMVCGCFSDKVCLPFRWSLGY